MKKRDIHIGQTYTTSGNKVLFRVVDEFGPGRWQVEYIGGLYRRGGGNRILEFQFGELYRPRVRPMLDGRLIIRSADIIAQVNRDDYAIAQEESRRIALDAIARLKEQELQRQFRRMFQISPTSWTYSPLMSWMEYDEIKPV